MIDAGGGTPRHAAVAGRDRIDPVLSGPRVLPGERQTLSRAHEALVEDGHALSGERRGVRPGLSAVHGPAQVEAAPSVPQSDPDGPETIDAVTDHLGPRVEVHGRARGEAAQQLLGLPGTTTVRRAPRVDIPRSV